MKVDLTLRGDLHAPRAARMALDDLVHDLDGRLLSDLRLVITEMVATIIRSGIGSARRCGSTSCRPSTFEVR